MSRDFGVASSLYDGRLGNRSAAYTCCRWLHLFGHRTFRTRRPSVHLLNTRIAKLNRGISLLSSPAGHVCMITTTLGASFLIDLRSVASLAYNRRSRGRLRSPPSYQICESHLTLWTVDKESHNFGHAQMAFTASEHLNMAAAWTSSTMSLFAYGLNDHTLQPHLLDLHCLHNTDIIVTLGYANKLSSRYRDKSRI